MFKQAKSAFIWYHLYKFRKTVILVVLLWSMVLFSQWIYGDVVEYLTLREKLEYLDILLPLKWGVIFFNIALSVWLVLRLFKKPKEVKVEPQKISHMDEKQKEKIEDAVEHKQSLSQREQSFLHRDLSSKAESIIKKS